MKKSGHRSKYRAEYPADFEFDYKDPYILSKFVIEGGKIIPQRISKLSSYQQRQMTRAVKQARNVALIPSGSDAHDRMPFADPISIQPFSY